MNIITVQDVKYISHELAHELLGEDEPIPDFDTRYPNTLEQCLASPFQRFGGKYVYSSLLQKAAVLFYLMIKNDPFQNGNKRLAVTTLMVFLYKNKKWLTVDPKELYNFAVWVAQSPAPLKDDVINATQTFIQKNITST